MVLFDVTDIVKIAIKVSISITDMEYHLMEKEIRILVMTLLGML